MFKWRVVTALLLLPLVAGLLFKADLTTFAAVLGLVCLLGAWEWARLAGLKSSWERALYVFSAALLMFAIWQSESDFSVWPTLFREDIGNPDTSHMPLLVMGLGVAFWLSSSVAMIAGAMPNRFLRHNKLLRLVSGWLVLLPLWVAGTGLRAENYDAEPMLGATWLLFVLVQVWAADTGAYFCGKTWGKTRLAPSISPGKTWEGAFGGLLAAILVAWLMKSLLSLDDLSWLETLLVSIAISIVSVVGDLTESVFKRLEGLKDSGRLLPGHGGVLDRIDSLTAAIPTFAVIYFVVLS
jgi:phosphatidate cytidylyltransferase